MLSITQEGDAVLRDISKPLPEELFNTPELRKMLAEMEETLDAQPDGVALAAPQVAISYRMFIVRYDRMKGSSETGESSENQLGVFINPRFVKSSKRQVDMQEGCLSVRGLYGTTLRHERATIMAQNEKGEWFTRGAGGILAQAFQHETDHLDGILFIDHAVDLYEQGSKNEHDSKQP